MGHEQWWRDAVVYQIYVRSFGDSDGDGLGDLRGIIEHLEHVVRLGVDAIWLNPCYPSPGHDGGYDVADYFDIDPAYGGMRAFDDLVEAAHARSLRVLMDIVPNHCSVEHPWFEAALASDPGSPERARFHFRDGKGLNGEAPPNNWRSTFGGSAWTRVVTAGVPEQWYLHTFDSSQPDFDWDHPDVPAMFDDVLRFWLERGADGFRIDVATAMVKAPGLPDAPDPLDNPYQFNRPGVHDVFRRWRRVVQEMNPEAPLVGEIWEPPAVTGGYLRSDQLHSAFYFDLLLGAWDAAAFRSSVTASLDSVPPGGGVPSWALSNHDVHRAVTRYGIVDPEPVETEDENARLLRQRGAVDVALGTSRARAAAMLLLALPGATYLYQGEELGLAEVQDLPDAARRDPVWFRSHGREHGRDGCRVPLPWTSAGDSMGFSAEGSAPPWLPQPDWFRTLAVDRQEAVPGSTLELYRAAVAMRRTLVDPADPLEWLETGRDDVIAFTRGPSTSVTVFGADAYDIPAAWGHVLLASSGAAGRQARPNSTVWLSHAAGVSKS